MEAFGIIGMSMGSMGFIFGIFGIVAYSRIDALEKKLKESGVLDKQFDSEK